MPYLDFLYDHFQYHWLLFDQSPHFPYHMSYSVHIWCHRALKILRVTGWQWLLIHLSANKVLFPVPILNGRAFFYKPCRSLRITAIYRRPSTSKISSSPRHTGISFLGICAYHERRLLNAEVKQNSLRYMQKQCVIDCIMPSCRVNIMKCNLYIVSYTYRILCLLFHTIATLTHKKWLNDWIPNANLYRYEKHYIINKLTAHSSICTANIYCVLPSWYYNYILMRMPQKHIHRSFYLLIYTLVFLSIYLSKIFILLICHGIMWSVHQCSSGSLHWHYDNLKSSEIKVKTYG